MQTQMMAKLEELAHLRNQNLPQIIGEAVEMGLSKMWNDTVLEQYLNKKISRRKAIRIAGLDLVKLAEQQNKIVQEDVKWGLSNETNRR